jgi:hypothetical protein
MLRAGGGIAASPSDARGGKEDGGSAAAEFIEILGLWEKRSLFARFEDFVPT